MTRIMSYDWLKMKLNKPHIWRHTGCRLDWWSFQHYKYFIWVIRLLASAFASTNSAFGQLGNNPGSTFAKSTFGQAAFWNTNAGTENAVFGGSNSMGEIVGLDIQHKRHRVRALEMRLAIKDRLLVQLIVQGAMCNWDKVVCKYRQAWSFFLIVNWERSLSLVEQRLVWLTN